MININDNSLNYFFVALIEICQFQYYLKENINFIMQAKLTQVSLNYWNKILKYWN